MDKSMQFFTIFSLSKHALVCILRSLLELTCYTWSNREVIMYLSKAYKLIARENWGFYLFRYYYNRGIKYFFTGIIDSYHFFVKCLLNSMGPYRKSHLRTHSIQSSQYSIIHLILSVVNLTFDLRSLKYVSYI